ncbi:hypothetical protein P3S67_005724 [Capsicum chacoense]
MTEAFKRLNLHKEALIMENSRLMEQIQNLQDRLSKFQTRKTHASTQTQSYPSPQKMNEKGVHSPLNAQKSIVPDVGAASPAQTVIGKDKSNPLRPVTLPKSEDEARPSSKPHKTSTLKKTLTAKKNNKQIEIIVKQTLEKFFSSQHMNNKDKPCTSTYRVVPDMNNTNINIPRSSDEEDDRFEDSLLQDAQDPYEDDDSGMSFDTIALHNLDT